MKALVQEFLSLWRWWAPPMILMGVGLAALLVWLGVVDAPIRYSIF